MAPFLTTFFARSRKTGAGALMSADPDDAKYLHERTDGKMKWGMDSYVAGFMMIYLGFVLAALSFQSSWCVKNTAEPKIISQWV